MADQMLEPRETRIKCRLDETASNSSRKGDNGRITAVALTQFARKSARSQDKTRSSTRTDNIYNQISID